MLINGRQEKQILEQAREERWAIGAFNAFDLNSLEAIMQAAEELGVPALVQTWDFYNPDSDRNSFSEFGAKVFIQQILQRTAASPVPVILHLDHTPTFAGCMRGIRNGWNSVMIDASAKSLEENIALSAKVVEAAHPCDVLVEGEIGHVAGNSGLDTIYTDVDEAAAYVKGSGIDLCAVSVGTVHGFYATEPKLNYDRIAELREAIDIPLVMHGGSGLTPEQFRKSIENGIVKINFATYVQIAGGKAIADAVEGVERPMFNRVVAAGQNAARDFIRMHMEIFGTRPVKL